MRRDKPNKEQKNCSPTTRVNQRFAKASHETQIRCKTKSHLSLNQKAT